MQGWRYLIIGAAAAAIAGCTGPDATRQAGASLDGGGFGEATARNAGLHSGQIDIAIDLSRRFAREVPSTVNFAFDRAVLDDEARAALQRQAVWIRQFPEVRFRVYGHTDLVGSNAYNQRLGKRRADAVVNYLVSQGIARSRLEAVASFGKTQPLVFTPEPERRNRRTVTEVSGFVKGHPMVLNGKYAEIIHREYIRGAVRVHPSVVGSTSTLDD